MGDGHGGSPDDALGTYAVGALDSRERRAAEKLLTRRPELRPEAERLREAARLMAFAGPSHRPPEGLEERVLSRVLEVEAAPAKRAGHGRARVRDHLPGRRTAVGIAVACAGLLLAARLRRARIARPGARSAAKSPRRSLVRAGGFRGLFGFVLDAARA